MSNRTAHTGSLVLSALFTALTAICAQLQIPLPAVPLSLALLPVLLCGALLPHRFSALSMLAYALLGAAGVPVFSGFAAGPSVLLGPTGGFILGYALCAPAISLLTRGKRFALRALLPAMAAGTLLCYAAGTLWFAFSTGAGLLSGLAACVLPFLPGDCVKLLLAAMLAVRIRPALKAIS